MRTPPTRPPLLVLTSLRPPVNFPDTAAEFAGQKIWGGVRNEREGQEDLRAGAVGFGRVERSGIESSLELISSRKLALLAFYELENVRDRQETWGSTNMV